MSYRWQPYEMPNEKHMRVDPYWIWASATKFADLPLADRSAPWIPVLLEARGSVGDFIARSVARKDLILVPGIYADRSRGLDEITFCTARVSEAFFGEAGADLR